MSENGKTDKPVPKAPAQTVPEQSHVGIATQAGASVDSQRELARTEVERGIYRVTGGIEGSPPLPDLQQRRTAPVRDAVARIMRKATTSPGSHQPSIPTGAGAPLTGELRARLEPKLGADLSSVRVHTGGESAQAATGFGAKAFTVGNDIHFNTGQYSPGTKEGNRLLGHELTHVVQGNNGGGVQRKAEGAAEATDEGAASSGLEVSQPHEPAEQEADKMGDHVADSLGPEAPEGEAKGKQEKPSPNGKNDPKGSNADTGKVDGAVKEAPAPKVAAKLEGVGRKVFLSGNRQNSQVPGVFAGATNVDQKSGKISEPGGTFTYTDTHLQMVDGKPTSVSTRVQWKSTKGEIADGVVDRSIKLEKDGTKTLICDQAFLDSIPKQSRYVTTDGAKMLPAGTPLHVYLTLRQMRMMGITEADMGKQLKKVKLSTIVNRQTIWDIAKALGGKQGVPTSEQILATHSASYAKNYVVQAGGVVTKAEIKDLRFTPMKAAARSGEDPLKLSGVDPQKPDTWAPSIGFSIVLEVGEKRPNTVPDEVPAGDK